MPTPLPPKTAAASHDSSVTTFLSVKKRLVRLLRNRGKHADEIEDLLQECFLRFHTFLARGQEVREPEAFLVRTIQNLAIDAHRRESRGVFALERPEDLQQLEDPAPLPDELVHSEQLLRFVQRTLDASLHTTTSGIYLSCRCGYTHREIASAMHMRVRTVSRAVERAWAAIANSRELALERHRSSRG